MLFPIYLSFNAGVLTNILHALYCYWLLYCSMYLQQNQIVWVLLLASDQNHIPLFLPTAKRFVYAWVHSTLCFSSLFDRKRKDTGCPCMACLSPTPCQFSPLLYTYPQSHFISSMNTFSSFKSEKPITDLQNIFWYDEISMCWLQQIRVTSIGLINNTTSLQPGISWFCPWKCFWNVIG